MSTTQPHPKTDFLPLEIAAHEAQRLSKQVQPAYVIQTGFNQLEATAELKQGRHGVVFGYYMFGSLAADFFQALKQVRPQ